MKLKRLLKNNFLFENGLNIGLNKEIVNKYDLKKREELSHEEYLQVLELAALSTSYYYLAKRDYSKKELLNKLLQKYWEKIPVLKVVKRLEELDYINDKEFAVSYVKNKKGGKKKLEYDLKLKGISPDIINDALLEYESDDELEELIKAWDKLGNKDEHKKIASLMRKGFDYGSIKKVINKKKEEGC
ncbi:regulatory protein RecX [Candidatus Cetobacterium colombiensis]|uniref:Regulatory protein RecX n=1 Tax=Candidatus Cetobacterium colombiensis TaxID=3073100 RepID=A0ABU4W9Z3_9FUSO|nr:RecX family transcriptional regulator [Candidatus Cetobacterium colombiensis]MDX8336357.1 RecX family transcriptional regulator [Candidatus Cetobacterium colombiensis]